MWLFYLYSPLTSCKKSEKSLKPFLRKLRYIPNNQPTSQPIITNNTNLIGPRWRRFNKTGDFPGSLKLTEIAPVHKNEDPFDKDNYRPICILPLISKYRKYLKKLYTAKFKATCSSTWIHWFADSDSVMVISMPFSDCYRHGKKNLMNQVILGQL